MGGLFLSSLRLCLQGAAREDRSLLASCEEICELVQQRTVDQVVDVRMQQVADNC